MKQILGLILVLFFVSCGTGNKKDTTSIEKIKSEIVEITYKVEGMHCTNCENSIVKGVNELDGIVEVKANHVDSTTYVKFDAQKANVEQIKEQIVKRGYTVAGEI